MRRRKQGATLSLPEWKALIKICCSVVPGWAQACQNAPGAAIRSAICQQTEMERKWRPAAHCFAAHRAFQMAVIYEPLTTLGLMNTTRHVFWTELAIGPLFEEQVNNFAWLVLLVGEHDADAICCLQWWKPISYMNKINISTTNLWL